MLCLRHKRFQIESAETIPAANKLLKLILDVGGEKRQILAGIAKYYAPDELPGKTIVIVSNLKPREMCGLTSYGMLLAAKNENGLSLITTDRDIASGASVG